MTSFESAFHSTDTLSLEACSVFARVTLQKGKKAWKPTENTTQGQKDSKGQLIRVTSIAKNLRWLYRTFQASMVGCFVKFTVTHSVGSNILSSI